jgi:hypothetical protein
MTSKTNGMVEKFNGRIVDVLKTNCLTRAQDMAHTLSDTSLCKTI